MKSKTHKAKSIVKFFALSLMLVAFVTPSFAQKNKEKAIDQARIQYKMSGEGQMAAMITGSTMELSFTPNNVKLVANLMSGMMKMDVRMDNKKSEGIMLMDMMGQKKVVEMDDEQMKKSKEKNQKPPQVEYTSKYKKIAGYKCQEARVTMEGVEEPAIVYITEKIKPSNLGDVSMMQFTGLKGFPLSWKIEQQGMTIIMEASDVSLDKLPKSTFDMKVPEGYEKMSMEDLQGMGGAFGM